MTSTIEAQIPEAQEVSVTGDTLKAELADGRTISVPLAWYPRLVHAAPGGNTEAFARKLAGSGKPLLSLDSPANANLMEMGAWALACISHHVARRSAWEGCAATWFLRFFTNHESRNTNHGLFSRASTVGW